MKTVSLGVGAAALVAALAFAVPALTQDKAEKPEPALRLAPAVAPPPRTQPASMGQAQLTFAPVVRRVAPAVVNVYAASVTQVATNPFFSDPLFAQL